MRAFLIAFLLAAALGAPAVGQSVITTRAALIVAGFNGAGVAPTIVTRENVSAMANPSTGTYTATLAVPCFSDKGAVFPSVQGRASGNCGGRFTAGNTITVTCLTVNDVPANIPAGARLSVIAYCGK